MVQSKLAITPRAVLRRRFYARPVSNNALTAKMRQLWVNAKFIYLTKIQKAISTRSFY